MTEKTRQQRDRMCDCNTAHLQTSQSPSVRATPRHPEVTYQQKESHRTVKCVSRKCKNSGYAASSLTDSLRSVVRLRRAVQAHTGGVSNDDCRKEKATRKRIRRCRFSIGSAPLTSIIKTDAQISGGETRQDYKDPRRFPLVAPSCALLFLPFGLPVSLRSYGRVFSFHA